MRFVDLEPKLYRYEDPGTALIPVDSIAEADCVWFLCPRCYVDLGGPVGCHSIACTKPGAPNRQGGKARWKISGASLEDLTLSPSIAVVGEGTCKAHFFIRAGEVVWA